MLVVSWKSYRGGKLSTVGLLVLTSLDKLLFILKILITFYKASGFIIRSTVLNLPTQLVFPDRTIYSMFVGRKVSYSECKENMMSLGG